MYWNPFLALYFSLISWKATGFFTVDQVKGKDEQLVLVIQQRSLLSCWPQYQLLHLEVVQPSYNSPWFTGLWWARSTSTGRPKWFSPNNFGSSPATNSVGLLSSTFSLIPIMWIFCRWEPASKSSLAFCCTYWDERLSYCFFSSLIRLSVTALVVYLLADLE